MAITDKPTVQTVRCPACANTLYETGPLDEERGVRGRVKDGPKIVQHEQGDFIKCAHCSKWVLMTRTYSGGLLAFDLDPSRRFFDKIPEE